MRMTFWAAALKLSAAVSKAVVDSVGVSSSSLASATLRDAPVYVNWLSGAELSLGWFLFSSLPVVGVPPGWGAFSSPPLGSFSSPPVVPPLEPEMPPSEPLLSGSELPAPVFLPSVVSPVWFFSVDWFSFSSPLLSEESLPLVSPG